MDIAKNKNGLSVKQAIFPMVGSILGSGVLTLPAAAEASGYLLSGPILIFVSSICAFTLFQLVHCARELGTENPSYFAVCQNAYPVLGYFAELCIGMQGFGAITVYVLILKQWVASLIGIKSMLEYMPYDILFTLLLLVIPTGLSLQKSLKKLSFISILSTVSVIFLSLFVLLSGILALVLPSNGIARDSIKAVTTAPSDIAKALSGYIFSLGCQQNMVSIFSLLENPTKANGARVGVIAVSIASVAYFLVANGGYIAGGNGQNTSILDVLADTTRPFYQIILSNFGQRWGALYFHLITLSKLAMIIVLLGAYPLQMHPTRDSVLTFLNIFFKERIAKNKRAVEISIIFLITAIVFIESLFNFSYAFVMNLIASTASCSIMFLLPSLCYILSRNRSFIATLISKYIFAACAMFSLWSTYSLLGLSIGSRILALIAIVFGESE
ncbi:hypothetical protein NERG_01566 [Nematocida ausubeli]|uniref:Amino acid transporter transmembrane domain-containing protein n=1 Tax=Nematocida ausubeli (strain ATCC PRA-371 / ERTm2) TaxID=1913371 RepID=H8ZD95_NEMA1|nr:hypothetical protein NERG_01566 [Nematocida ausubeli]